MGILLVVDKAHIVDEAKTVEPTILQLFLIKMWLLPLAYLDEALALTERTHLQFLQAG
jgi:hypothetical protein